MGLTCRETAPPSPPHPRPGKKEAHVTGPGTWLGQHLRGPGGGRRPGPDHTTSAPVMMGRCLPADHGATEHRSAQTLTLNPTPVAERPRPGAHGESEPAAGSRRGPATGAEARLSGRRLTGERPGRLSSCCGANEHGVRAGCPSQVSEPGVRAGPPQ
ncbi:translation initiation factor IF-2-like [Phyllostomus hastatus]|uniref:translation initiation factor IF-2-like n=1 Tax=Phyllostomus hastatus TaxID=9423 RepID=UPI001E68138F|nr:translation initiation factor IF-2-like [Phyllostomus hastatus]